ncbi:hypothetical protein SAMN05444287_1552 [Octadecabacter temperatus]|uniref:Uncharacterized protein n=1 Tax=Octadecabacter temperatus TaxID=1458307 RepID=A0A0K0Y6B1_9RHOB|nr:DUF6778 family protein [Octadecabacter temperatus]AKS46436.1 hypothetical protein OSB_18960 [Octadecabacter temperatus]SIO14004.1 hypothetical protein SAMN05444287_1552 [Octadecabacter temperatus]
MKLLLKTVAFGAVAAALTACSNVDTVTRNAPLEAPRIAAVEQTQIVRDYSLEAIRFAAPSDMRVSEANSYYPIADVVWRGDPLGNRLEQISAIFQTSIQAAGENLTGATPVIVDVELARFHSLTERTRYSVGGVHSIKFDLTVRDAATGEILEATRRIDGDLAALGGYAALAADNEGQGQKVRITAHLTQLFTRELTGLTNVVTIEQAGS